MLGALWLAGCSHEGAEWKSASTADTPEAYQHFLSLYPKSANAAQAQARIRQLQDDRDWQVATAADSREGYERYLSQHADGSNAQEARIRLENFAQAAAPASTASSPTAAAAKPAVPAKPAIAVKPTPGSHAATGTGGKSQLATSAGAHYVQLGAFSSQTVAESFWKRLSSKYTKDFANLTPRYVAGKSKSGAVVRLQVAVNSRAQGKALCDKLKAHGQSCVAVSAG